MDDSLRGKSPAHAGGFTYLGVLFLVALVGAGLVSVAEVWHTLAQHDKETELLFIGNQFRSAIERYYGASPGAAQYPKSLEDLLEDKRFPNVRRHLRRIYVDPMTGKSEWGLTQLEGVGIVGVHSLSDAVPLKQANFAARDAAFVGAKTYRDWVFAFQPAAPGASSDAAPGGTGTAPQQPLQPVQLQPPTPNPTGTVSNKPPSDLDADRKARERLCQIRRAADTENCRIAAQQNGPQLADRCNTSVELRYQACLDLATYGSVPLDTSAY